MSDPRTWPLSPAEFYATREKLEKLNKRAAKRGFTGRLDVTYTKRERKIRDDLGFTRTIVIFDTLITGTPAKYDGWTFVASIDKLDKGFIINGAPGADADSIDPDTIKAGHCDHCQTVRNRKSIFIIDNDDGRRLQVGSTCIKDFLGWNTSPVFYGENDLADDFDDGFGIFGGYREHVYDVPTIIAYAWAVTAIFGFVRADEPTTTTKDRLRVALRGPKVTDYGWDQDSIDRLHALAGEADDRVKEIIDFIKGDEFAGDNGYVTNLKVLVNEEYADQKYFGLLASAPNALTRYREQQAAREAREAENAEMVNEYIGQPKERLELTVTVRAIRFINGNYGTTTLYTFITEDKRLVKWFASGCPLGEDVEGETYRLVGTVKKHDEYQGQKSTVLTRCKVLEEAKT